MSDSFEFTLHSPLSKEDWDKLTDVELEKTEHIWFETHKGEKVDYILANMLDKIRAEIDSYCGDNRDRNDGLYIAMRIIDKYRAESEG